MAQSSALREQPSMDDILASIRRIIDAGEVQARPPEEKAEEAAPPEPVVTVPPPPANDEGVSRTPAPRAALPNTPKTHREPEVIEGGGKAADTIAAAVSAYLEKEQDSKAAPAPAPEKAADPIMPPMASQTMPEPDISEVEAALRAEFNPVDREVLTVERQAKYDSRFTEADDGAFRQVANLLRDKVGDAPLSPPVRETPADKLVSDAVSQSVSHSFASLSDVLLEKHGRDLDMMAEEMLRPMLQEWLDNNLPSLVERLVRSEIERIARGEPRVA